MRSVSMSLTSPAAGSKWRELLLLTALLCLCLLPFAGKPLHIDDPLFVWTAEQILSDPLDFYGFELNWDRVPQPMWLTMKNPPAASYYLAATMSVLGGSEVALHLALFVPALLVAWGTYFLARRLSAPPLLSALISVLSPVFMISATTVMCDVLMLACWVWAVFFWDRGLRDEDGKSLLAAALLTAACALTKYFGMALIPLFVATLLLQPRRAWRSLIALLVPIAILAAYQWGTFAFYGKGLLFDAASYATARRAETPGEWLARFATGLSFLGGCAASVVCLAPLLLTRRLAAMAGLGCIFLLPLLFLDPVVTELHLDLADLSWVLPQLAFWIVAGAGILALTLAEARRRWGPESLLLMLWIGGTFVFAGFVNWTVNGRSLLPLIPALGILTARRLADPLARSHALLLGGLGCSAILALAGTWADYGQARAARTAAERLVAEYADSRRPLWFQGHWGFQHYAQLAGARPLDMGRATLRPHDLVLVPLGNSGVRRIPASIADLVATRDFPTPRWVSTMGYRQGPGFYSSTWGPLPFSFGPGRPEPYLVYQIRPHARPLEESR